MGEALEDNCFAGEAYAFGDTLGGLATALGDEGAREVTLFSPAAMIPRAALGTRAGAPCVRSGLRGTGGAAGSADRDAVPGFAASIRCADFWIFELTKP